MREIRKSLKAKNAALCGPRGGAFCDAGEGFGGTATDAAPPSLDEASVPIRSAVGQHFAADGVLDPGQPLGVLDLGNGSSCPLGGEPMSFGA
jgi:hypothetical protein